MWMALLAAAWGCRRTPRETHDAMDRAETLMEKHPDSALNILAALDTNELHGKADKARMALLMSMAVDKNLIDTTDFSILQPALDYYISHGNPDQRLKTRYYQGRIYMNRGEDVMALTSFLHAAEDSASCSDSLALARLLVVQGRMAVQQLEFDDFINNNLKAASIYHKFNNQLREIRCIGRALSGSITAEKDSLAKSILSRYDRVFYNYLDQIDYLPGCVLMAYIMYKPDDELKKMMSIVDTIPNMPGDTHINMAMAWNRLGDTIAALKALPPMEMLESQVDSIKYKIVLNEIQEYLGDKQEVLKGYKSIMDDYQEFMNDTFHDSIMYTRQTYNIESGAKKELTKSETHKNTFLIIALIALGIVMLLGCVYYFKSKRFSSLQKKYARMADDLEWERKKLMSIHTFNQETREVINKRLALLDGLFIDKITNNDIHSELLNEELARVHDEQEEFLKSLREVFVAYHSEFMRTHLNAELTKTELNYLSLLAIGLTTKDISSYLGIKAIYNVTASIRKKIGFTSRDKNLSDHLTEIFKIY